MIYNILDYVLYIIHKKIKLNKSIFNNIFLKKKNYKIFKYNLNISNYIIYLIILIFISLFILIYKYLNSFIAAILLSFFISFIPYYLLIFFENNKKEKIILSFPNFLINLKNYCLIKNDIIEALNRVNIEGPINEYIYNFNCLVKRGVPINECFDNLRKDINIKTLNNYLMLIEYCYLNGGDFVILIDKMLKIIIEKNIRKEKEKQNNFSTKIMIYIIILINIIVVKLFIFDSQKYFYIITQTMLGKCILDLNIITYFIIIFINFKLNKMEE